jgi:hypothetical protein
MSRYANPDPVVETSWPAAHLGDPSIRIVDTRWSTRQRDAGVAATGAMRCLMLSGYERVSV